MKLSLSKIGLLLALPFIGVVFFDAYQLVELLNIGSQQKRFGISMFLSAAYPWALVLNPIMQKIYVLLETRTAEPMYIFWLVCTALNAVLAYISGASVNLKSLSKVGAVLGGGHIFTSLLGDMGVCFIQYRNRKPFRLLLKFNRLPIFRFPSNFVRALRFCYCCYL